MILQTAQALGGWAWVVVALVLFALEIMLPGSVLLWFALAALTVGIAALLIDLSWQVELAAFVVLAPIFLLAGRRFFAPRGNPSSAAPALNERAQAHIGRELTLAEPLVGGAGRVKLGDSVWMIEGEDAPAGTRVRVVAANGTSLRVERA